MNKKNNKNNKNRNNKKNNIDELPNEIAFNILLNLDYNDIQSYCSTSNNVKNVCNDEFFWKSKLYKDYNNVDELKTQDKTWKETYITTYKIMNVIQNINIEEIRDIIEDFTNDDINEYLDSLKYTIEELILAKNPYYSKEAEDDEYLNVMSYLIYINVSLNPKKSNSIEDDKKIIIFRRVRNILYNYIIELLDVGYDINKYTYDDYNFDPPIVSILTSINLNNRQEQNDYVYEMYDLFITFIHYGALVNKSFTYLYNNEIIEYENVNDFYKEQLEDVYIPKNIRNRIENIIR